MISVFVAASAKQSDYLGLLHVASSAQADASARARGILTAWQPPSRALGAECCIAIITEALMMVWFDRPKNPLSSWY